MSISIALKTSLRVFNELLELVKDSQYSYGAEVPAASWYDERGRLRIWAANVGAHQTGQSSLDFRLRDTSHVRQEILDLLADLRGLLDDIIVYFKEEPSEDELWSEDESDDDPTTELQSYFRRVNTTIKCLYKMAMLIRNPAQHDMLRHSQSDETAAFKPFDQQYVRDKFPQASEQLVLSLGGLITRRRRYLKYRERHNIKLGKGLEKPEDEELSLFALPRDDTESEEQEDGFENTTSDEELAPQDDAPEPAAFGGSSSFSPFGGPERIAKNDFGVLDYDPVLFRDVVGRESKFPFYTCNAWERMEQSITTATRDIEEIQDQVLNREYNIFGPDGLVIPAASWGSTIKPGMKVSMNLWPSHEGKARKLYAARLAMNIMEEQYHYSSKDKLKPRPPFAHG
ncbi:MAG: hypothetical protein LQ350_007792 [Teloschistes chrysophthalmus]|nr:MAG: hypothetical protein LQ350_007792 [Niorma chrysophthalma]